MFKQIVAALVIMVSASSVSANDEFCSDVGGLARDVMEFRQMGVPMSKVMGALANGSDVEFNGVMKNMIIEAYEYSQYSTKSVAESRINKFGNDWELNCYKGEL